MLSVARTMADEEGRSIVWSEGQAEALPFPDETFDLVFSQFALMFFTDKAAALAEMRRVLAPDGRVTLSVFQAIDRHPFYQALDKAIDRRLGTSAVEQIFALGDAMRWAHGRSGQGSASGHRAAFVHGALPESGNVPGWRD